MRLSTCRVSTVDCSVSRMSRTSTSSCPNVRHEVFGVGLDEVFRDGVIVLSRLMGEFDQTQSKYRNIEQMDVKYPNHAFNRLYDL